MIFFELNRPHGIDFPQFFEASKMWWRGDNPYLTLITSPGPFNYPPSSFLFLWWLDMLPFFWSGVVWNFLSLFSFLLSLYLLGKIIWKKNWNILYFLIAVLFFTVPFFPEKFNLGNGQMNNFILLFVVISWWLQTLKKKWLGAITLAYAISIKLTPVVFLLPLLIMKDFKQVCRVVVLTGFFLFLPLLLFNWNDIQPYVSSIFFEGFALHGKAIYYNQSLLAFLLRMLPENIAVMLFKISLIILPLFSIYYLKKNRVGIFAKSVAVSTCLYLLLHPLAWQHHFVFAVIPFLVGWKCLPKWLVVISYLLLAGNIKNPELISSWGKLILSHQFLGTFLLWIGFMWGQKRKK